MRNRSYLALATVLLGLLALLVSFGAALALFDIVRGKESNLVLEWIGIWGALPVLVFAQIV